MVRWARAAVLSAAVGFAEAADADALAQVDVAGDAGGAGVEPVGRLRGEFVAVRGLDGVDPAFAEMGQHVKRSGKEEETHTGNLQLSLPLQEGGVCIDELLSLHAGKDVGQHHVTLMFELGEARASILISERQSSRV